MLLPPGEYRVAAQPVQYQSARLVWPAKVQVAEGKQAVLSMASGIQSAGPKGAGSKALYPAFCFRIIAAGGTEAVQYGSGTVALQLVPPGTNRVEVRAYDNVLCASGVDKVGVAEGILAKDEMPG